MCHVLVIEDEPMIAMMLQDILADAGATSFDVASTEQDAVASALQHPPKIIVSDVRLLDGTGPAAVQQIHQRLGETPVMYITASPEECTAIHPCAPVLRKPIRVSEVETVFHRLVSQ